MKLFNIFLILALLSLILSPACKVKTEPGQDKFTARMIVTQGMSAAGQTGRLTMNVTHWATPDERDKLFNVLEKDGEEAFIKEMRKHKAGTLYHPGSTAWGLNYAHSESTAKGQRIRLVTLRPIHFGEFKAASESIHYEFGFIEFTMGEKGKGEGRILPNVKIKMTKDGRLNIESLGTSPIKLMDVEKK